MFTNQKVLGLILVLLIIGAAIYFTASKFKQEVILPSPSPSSQNLDFILSRSPAPQSVVQQNSQSQQPYPQPQELPFSKNKRLSQFPGIVRDDIRLNKKAVIQTKKGIFELQIYPEASMAASNFMLLAANGFYDGLIFHRVEDWVVQGGDPLGNGNGGPGYTEVEHNLFGKYDKGIVAYAKRQDEPPGTFGSQFFIMLKDQPLPLEYAIFGKVISGMDVVEKIEVGDVIQKVVIQNLK